MPRYLAVRAVQDEGRPVDAWRAAAPASAPPDRPDVPEGFRLVAVVDNGAWQSAVDVTYPDYYARLRRRCAEGVWKALSLYLIDGERAAAIEDGRRATMDGTPVRDPGRTVR